MRALGDMKKIEIKESDGSDPLPICRSHREELIERFKFDEALNELSYDITVSDPETFTQTLTAEDYIQFRWEPGLDFLPYECVKE